ncbi:MAG: DedA family protein [Alicyclobacillus sp.]|nr:DedA family protein [Alicyclobacillus sp.]
MHSHIVHMLHTYGYPGLFVALAMEYLFIPVPGETTLVTVGILWKQGYGLNLGWLLAATTLGTFVGSMFAYTVGRVLGRPFLERFGRYVRLTSERIDKADALFSKYTVPTLIFSRYIAGVRIIIPYIAGINKIPLSLYSLVMLVGSLLWTVTFILAGNVVDRGWHQFIRHWRTELIPAIIVVIAAIVGYRYLHRWMHRKINE